MQWRNAGIGVSFGKIKVKIPLELEKLKKTYFKIFIESFQLFARGLETCFENLPTTGRNIKWLFLVKLETVTFSQL